MSISQNKGMLSHDESRKIVSRITKTIIFLFSYLKMSIFTNSACSLVSILVLLLVVLCRMFFHHVSLEIWGSSALVVAVSTGKGLLTSVTILACYLKILKITRERTLVRSPLPVLIATTSALYPLISRDTWWKNILQGTTSKRANLETREDTLFVKVDI